jgi:DNA-binding beta-propeller fold protein YncE
MHTITNLVLGAAASLALATGAAYPAAAQTHGAVIASDYVSAGTVGLLDLADPWPVTADLASIHADAAGRWHDGLVYIVNRAGGDNVQVLDPASDLTVVRQYSLGLGRNLQDIAFLDDGTALVSCYDTAELLHVDPQTGDILDIVATGGFADADGLPETNRLHRLGDRVFLTCERLDRDNWYAPVGDSYLLVLDVATLSWVDCDPVQPGVQGIRLAAANPTTDIVRDGDRLLVGCTGYYALLDGGVDVIDPAALLSLGLEITEAALGGDVVALTGGPAGRRHVIASSTSFATSVKAYRPGGGIQVLASSSAYDHAAVAWDGGQLVFVADRALGSAGVRVFDATSGVELTTAPVATGLPPALFILPDAAAVPVLDLPGAGLAMAAPWPNPANPSSTVAFTAPAATSVLVRLVDLRGRLVRQATVTVGPDGNGRWTFDGRDHRGRPAASGVYRCVVEGAGGFAARSLTIVR